MELVMTPERKLYMYLTVCIFLMVSWSWAGEVRYYVSPLGNDAWSGQIADASAGGDDGPFATLKRARDAIREHKAAQASGEAVAYTVMVKDGTYYLDEPLILNAEDSGRQGKPVRFTAYPGARPVLSGGQETRGWEKYKGNIWQCDVSGLGLKKEDKVYLFCQDQWQRLARVPNVDPDQPRTSGFLMLPMDKVTEGTERVKEDNQEGTLAYDPANWRTWQQADVVEEKGSKRILFYDKNQLDPSGWSHPDEVWVHIAPYHNWNINYIRLQEIDAEGGQMLLSEDAQYELERDTRFYFDNIFEELDAPGEWYLDYEKGRLYLWPGDGKCPEGRVVISKLSNLVSLTGQGDRHIEYVEFGGFDMKHFRGGYAITVSGSRHCWIFKNRITLGTNGIALDGNEGRVVGNDVAYLSAVGIAVGGENNVVENNYVHDLFTVDIYSWSAASIGGLENMMSHNVICYVPSLGVSFGGHGNTIEYNDIHHIGLETTLSGGIYAHAATKAESEHTKRILIRYNKITDTVGYGMAAPGEWGSNPGWGLWLDDFISNVTVYGNILIRNARGAVQLHGGRNNRFENNIMSVGLPSTINHIRKGTEPCNNYVAHNIICYPNPDPAILRRYGRVVKGITGSETPVSPLFLCGWHLPKNAIKESDYNLFYPISDASADDLHYFIGAGDAATGDWAKGPVADRFAWWRSLGYDKHSITGDPLFVDISKDDFRLKEGSPAIALGFKPIPIEKIGLYESEDRASWPVGDTRKRWRGKTVEPYASFIH